jgi:dihydrofolate reductase
MRKIIVSEFVTLDGVMEGPGGADKFEHAGWSMPYFNEEIGKFKFDELFASDALLLGRVTYQAFAKDWPSMTDEGLIEGFAGRMNSLPKYVVSTTLQEVAWNNSRLIKGNIAEEVSKLKHEVGQDILIAGSGELVYLLQQHDLIDEYRIMVHPVVLGSGKRLFRDGSDTTVLRLVETRTFSSGVVVLSYQKA